MFALRISRLAAWLSVVSLSNVLGTSAMMGQGVAGDKKKEIPPPADVQLETLDGMRLTATFYPSNAGEEAVPVVLLHMLEGSRADYRDLALSLQSQGHAVLVPDLRGHGDSKTRTRRTPDGRVIRETLNVSSMSRVEFENMVRFDMPRLKQFLLEKNNTRELNIERLSVVGAELGASVALHWTRLDWSIPPEGYKKQGQDIKVLVLISPEWSTQGLPLGSALAGAAPMLMVRDPQLQRVFKEPDAMNFRVPVPLDFRSEVSVMITTGNGKSKAVGDAGRLNTILKTYHPDQNILDLIYGTFGTTLQGTKILHAKGLLLAGKTQEEHILRFIELRAVKRSFKWEERKNPYG